MSDGRLTGRPRRWLRDRTIVRPDDELQQVRKESLCKENLVELHWDLAQVKYLEVRGPMSSKDERVCYNVCFRSFWFFFSAFPDSINRTKRKD